MAPVLVTPEVVLDERDGESFAQGAPYVSVVDFWCEDRNMRRTGSKIFRMGDKEVVEHGSSSNESSEYKD